MSGQCTSHTNGTGQSFSDCAPLCDAVGNGGSGQNCTQQGALDACNAYMAANGGGTCTLYTCDSGLNTQYIYLTQGITQGDCSSWSYYQFFAPYVGQVFQNTSTTCTFGCAAYDTGVYWQ
jgi:hypothetical protein